jgi:hypothetical protein
MRRSGEGHVMPSDSEEDLPIMLRWNRIVIYDPPPDWWVSEIDPGTQRQLAAIRLETMQKILQVHAEGLAAAVNVLRQ